MKVRESERSQKADQREEKAEEKDQGPDVVKEHGGKKEKKERVSLTFFDRLSAPKYGRKDSDYTSPSKKDVPVIQVWALLCAYYVDTLNNTILYGCYFVI